MAIEVVLCHFFCCDVRFIFIVGLLTMVNSSFRISTRPSLAMVMFVFDVVIGVSKIPLQSLSYVFVDICSSAS